ncbi:MAG: TIGR00730 family Rossman fold protein, partial [Bacteroidia bacterium]|nr:TIGR00730 family Rossman fold protein [Bacteroidia bacterium]
VCVFCGSSDGNNPLYKTKAIELGKLFAENNLRLVYGGGGFGLMGAIANAVLENGGEVIGVIPDRLVQRERAHNGLTELLIVNTMNERKEKMAELSDVFVTMPGGYGTLDELFEMLTWKQLGIQNKYNIIYNVNSFFNPLLDQLKTAAGNGFLKEKVLGELVVLNTAEELIQQIKSQS